MVNNHTRFHHLFSAAPHLPLLRVRSRTLPDVSHAFTSPPRGSSDSSDLSESEMTQRKTEEAVVGKGEKDEVEISS